MSLNLEGNCWVYVMLMHTVTHCEFNFNLVSKVLLCGLCNFVCLVCLQWQFLSRDDGEADTLADPSWQQDEGTQNY